MQKVNLKPTPNLNHSPNPNHTLTQWFSKLFCTLTPNESIQISVHPVQWPSPTVTNTRKECVKINLSTFYLKCMIKNYNPKICLVLRGHSVIPIRSHDYLLIPWMVQLTPGDRYRPYENHCPNQTLS